MTSEEVYTALTTRTDIRISRYEADKGLLHAQTYGYYGIDKQDGSRVSVKFDADGFHVVPEGDLLDEIVADHDEHAERSLLNDALTAINPRQALAGHEGESYPVQVTRPSQNEV